MRYFLQLAYKGTNYHGWQIQENATSVQQEINKALSIILREQIMVTGAGRTDTGVHAKQMFAHFDTNQNIDTQKLAFQLNSLLSNDILIEDIMRVGDDAHARFDAIERTYEYHLSFQADPFRQEEVFHYKHSLDTVKMNDAAKLLFDHIDFTSFSKHHTQTKTNDCKVTKAEWTFTENGLLFTISADRFLRNMVRAIVGTLLEVGRGRMTAEEFEQVILSKDRKKAGFSVPAHGLYLSKISYPNHIFL